MEKKRTVEDIEVRNENEIRSIVFFN